MASFWYHESMTKVLAGSIDLDTDSGVKIGLWSESETGVKDDEFANDLTDELNATNYTSGFGGAGRKALANRVINDDPTNDRAVFDNTADITWTTIGNGSNDTIAAAIILKEVTADSDSPVIIYLDVDNYLTTGGDYTIQFADGATQGIGYVSC